MMSPSFNTGSTAAYISHISATVPSITFHHLPAIPLDLDSFPSMEAIIFEVLRLSNPHVRRALQFIASVSAFVIDFFCSSSLPISDELNIPTFFFLPSGACVLAFFLYFPKIHQNMTLSFKDMKNTLLHVPGIPPIPSSDMIRPMLDRESTDYKNFLDSALKFPNSAGLIVNTFERLESKPLKSIQEGKCNPDGNTPPVFCVGPLLATENRHGAAAAVHDCLKWLDSQPSKSVVYLCFGSLGLFSSNQLHEIALGLERSGQRFLWVVWSPPLGGERNRFLPPPEPDLDVILPAGFVDRTRDRRLVVKSWTPQVAVLNHASVGGVVMVEDMKVALRMNEAAEDGFVAAEEVERRVRELMESEKGNNVRKVVEEMSVAAREALSDGGSSIVALEKLVQLWKSG
ncbi:hypothetical protein BUALT_Bualt06G0100900 [Buddleja alternifolia]|uniref:Uncharacterized protein n=1 Tax=Buddleja alternifolia TaxID=168488 RepID=A0AAV6XE78_9LAMI|nr:hypothetical protein BUALT_Bualt06G0100900 [Buddleja alternifolia]